MLHADVDGSLEAITTSLLAVNTGRIVYKVVTAAVGPPSLRHVQMAQDTGACIVCFGVNIPAAIKRDADSRGVSTVHSKCGPLNSVRCTDFLCSVTLFKISIVARKTGLRLVTADGLMLLAV
jgi:hypothetical protein